MGKKSIKKNYIYNLSYQVLLLLTPLITTPYLSRVLGADGVGTVSFAESVVSYFTLFATLGIATFGQREISYVQDEKIKRTQVFWETKALQVITSTVVLIIYISFSFFQTNKILYLILSFNIIAVLVDVVWLLQGMEEFGKIVFRNIIFKIISIAYIFIAVKTKDDIIKYVFGIAFFLFLSNASLWAHVSKYVGKPRLKDIKPFRNIKVVLSLFVPTIAIQIYTVLDKTMIGLITQSAFENGYYEQAIKLSKMVLVVVTSLGTVMIPRIGYHYERGETETVKRYMYRGYRFVWFLGIPLCFGLVGTAANFVPWFFGEGYDKVVPLLSVLSFLILAIGINNVTGMQYLIPTKRQNIFTMTVIIGAVVNCSLNLVLIHFFQSIGAAIASVAAETTIALVQLYLVRKELSVKEVFLSSWHYFVAGGIMLVLLKVLGNIWPASIMSTILMVIMGAITYFFILLILKDSFFLENTKHMIAKIKGKVKRG